MSELHVERIIKRHKAAMERTAQWRSLLDATYFYAMPNRNPWEMSQQEGAQFDTQVYDLTLVVAMKKFVNKMLKALMPPEINWLKLIPGREIPKDEKEAVETELQQVTETFFFYLRKSNFDLAIEEAFADMGISTGVLQLNEGELDDPLQFSSVPNDQVGFESNPVGKITGMFRQWDDMLIEHAQEMWHDELVIPTEVFNMQEPRKMCVKECSYWDYKKKIYKYYVIESKYKAVMLEKEFEVWPWIVFRWSRRAGEDRGRGVAMEAMPAAASINKALEDELIAAALTAVPTYMGFHDYIINPYNFRVEPNSIIAVNPSGAPGGWPIAPLPRSGDISFNALVINDLRAQVNELMLTQPLQPNQNEPVRTATEVSIIQNELRENAGAAFNRVQRELFDPLVKNVLYILRKTGKISKDIKIDGEQVAISYQTPLTLSKDNNDARNFIEYYQILMGMFTPGIAFNLVDSPKLPHWIASKLNIDLTMVKDENEIKLLIQQALEQAQQAAEQQQPQESPEVQQPAPFSLTG